ncbi:MAG: UDP-N-acetylglucosamine--N-acetylmuramyl-(pentapeptide) pyrophosphoryl-undecaprenol N-acetylglucosamine transferase [bacterium]|nr:UDP-N-acetylglucosamine--N-acetylmuramyl-(pentapeptide) pyrophosphoryl-undecaprenol N-acetylglucosamine transferase [bacterium]
MKILFTGGGTGGHILPIIAVARELRKQQDSPELAGGLEFFYMGPKDDFAEILLSQEGIKVYHALAGKIRRYGGFKTLFPNLLDTFVKTPLGIFQALLRMFLLSPDLILSKGGYGALPATIAGWMLQIPIVLHESDTVPGLSNRVGGFFASQIFVSFPRTSFFPAKKMAVVGNPIRKGVLVGSKEEAQRLLELKGGKPVILFMGGSQGAQRINDMLLAILQEALKDFEIIHQAGEKNFVQVREEAKTVVDKELLPYYHAVSFLKEQELRHVYAATDFIVSRAGSGSIFEIAALGKPSILIPLPEAAQNHQIQNAYEYANTGAAIVLEESNLAPHFFLEKLRYLVSNSQELAKMSAAALQFAKPEAATTIARYLIESSVK